MAGGAAPTFFGGHCSEASEIAGVVALAAAADSAVVADSVEVADSEVLEEADSVVVVPVEAGKLRKSFQVCLKETRSLHKCSN